MTERFTAFDITDVRFPTSRELDGSDAMNADPDYSAAYVVARTDARCGGPRLRLHDRAGQRGRRRRRSVRSNRCSWACRSTTCSPTWARLSRRLVHDSQLRWLGPEKGVMHMAIGAVLNAVWDLYAKREGKPLWKLLADLSPARDRRPRRLPLPVRRPRAGRGARHPHPRRGRGQAGARAATLARRLPGVHDLRGLARLQRREGGAPGRRGARRRLHPSQAEGRRRHRGRRCAGARWSAIWPGRDVSISIDANQRWDVGEAIANVAAARADRAALGRGADDSRRHPRPPQDRRGDRAGTRSHRRARRQPRRVQAAARQPGAIQVCQIDACRVAGVNENLAILLLAAKFGVPVCPHAGGVGLCEVVQHLSMFDFVARQRQRPTAGGSSTSTTCTSISSIPVRLRGGRYLAPERPGTGAPRCCRTTLADYRFPDGSAWQDPTPTGPATRTSPGQASEETA